MPAREEQRQLLALCAIKGIDRSVLAREAQRRRSIKELAEGRLTEESTAARSTRELIVAAATSLSERLRWIDEQLTLAESVSARLVTVLDEDYPHNLRLIYNLPPFLFYRGSLQEDDSRSVAVVGTRTASATGIEQARAMATHLARLGVTVVSGLAKGIDTAAHEATLAAGGRTIAVIGTGILRCYPPENRQLAERIVERGAMVSQFWPDSPPTRSSFPLRNVVTSGISQGSVVIEASSTSGAKMQARLALEHGKKVFLLKSLVTNQRWAQTYMARPGAVEVATADDVARHLRSDARVAELSSTRRQLVLDLA